MTEEKRKKDRARPVTSGTPTPDSLPPGAGGTNNDAAQPGNGSLMGWLAGAALGVVAVTTHALDGIFAGHSDADHGDADEGGTGDGDAPPATDNDSDSGDGDAGASGDGGD